MNYYPTRLDILAAMIVTLAALSWAGCDEQQDAIKTAEVIADIQASNTKEDQVQPRQNRDTANYDRIASNTINRVTK